MHRRVEIGKRGIESLELQNEPAKNSTDGEGVKIKSIKLLAYPNTTKGHQDSGVYKYYVDSPTRDRHQGPALARRLQGQDHQAEYAGCERQDQDPQDQGQREGHRQSPARERLERLTLPAAQQSLGKTRLRKLPKQCGLGHMPRSQPGSAR